MPVGYQFPFQVSSGSVGYFQMTQTQLEATKANLKVLILTNRGERPMNFDFGCNLREFLFEQLTRDELGQKIADRIAQQVSLWMPSVSLTNLNVMFSEDESSIAENEARVFLTFKLNSSPATDSLSVTVAP